MAPSLEGVFQTKQLATIREMLGLIAPRDTDKHKTFHEPSHLKSSQIKQYKPVFRRRLFYLAGNAYSYEACCSLNKNVHSSSRVRTCDLTVNSRTLYQLSYRGFYDCNVAINHSLIITITSNSKYIHCLYSYIFITSVQFYPTSCLLSYDPSELSMSRI